MSICLTPRSGSSPTPRGTPARRANRRRAIRISGEKVTVASLRLVEQMRGSIFLLNRHPYGERAHPLARVVREELAREVRMAEHAARVEGVAEGERAAQIPLIADALDRPVLLALERFD